MNFKSPARYKPLLVGVGLFAVAVAFYIGNVVFAEPAPDCCATEFDPTPYQQVPVESIP